MNEWLEEISRLVDDEAMGEDTEYGGGRSSNWKKHVRTKAEYRRTPTVFRELHSTCCWDCTAVLADIQQCCATCNEMKVNVVESANSCAYFAQNRNVRTLQVQSFHSVASRRQSPRSSVVKQSLLVWVLACTKVARQTDSQLEPDREGKRKGGSRRVILKGT